MIRVVCYVRGVWGGEMKSGGCIIYLACESRIMGEKIVKGYQKWEQRRWGGGVNSFGV